MKSLAFTCPWIPRTLSVPTDPSLLSITCSPQPGAGSGRTLPAVRTGEPAIGAEPPAETRGVRACGQGEGQEGRRGGRNPSAANEACRSGGQLAMQR